MRGSATCRAAADPGLGLGPLALVGEGVVPEDHRLPLGVLHGDPAVGRFGGGRQERVAPGREGAVRLRREGKGGEDRRQQAEGEAAEGGRAGSRQGRKTAEARNGQGRGEVGQAPQGEGRRQEPPRHRPQALPGVGTGEAAPRAGGGGGAPEEESRQEGRRNEQESPGEQGRPRGKEEAGKGSRQRPEKPEGRHREGQGETQGQEGEAEPPSGKGGRAAAPGRPRAGTREPEAEPRQGEELHPEGRHQNLPEKDHLSQQGKGPHRHQRPHHGRHYPTSEGHGQRKP